MADYILQTDTNHPLFDMVRSTVIVLGEADTDVIRDCINQKVYPRVRSILLSAKNANTRDEGINVFLLAAGANKTFADLADTATADAVSTAINNVLGQPNLKDQFEQAMANMAAGFLTISQVGIVEQFYKTGADLISRADKDLYRIVDGPFFKAAVTSLVNSQASDEASVVTLYIAAEADPTTYDETTRVVSLFPGAVLAAGTWVCNLWIGSYKVSVPVTNGDTALQILYKLLTAHRAKQLTLEQQGLPLMNVAIGVNEGSTSQVTANFMWSAGMVPPLAYTTGQAVGAMHSLSLHALNYDNSIDAQMVTLEMGQAGVGNDLDTLGIPGLVYGISTDYGKSTSMGPHSVLMDIKTGKATTTASTKTSANMITDTFYFQVDPTPGSVSFWGQGVMQATETLKISVNKKDYTFSVPTGSSDLTFQQVFGTIATELTRDSRTLFGSKLTAIATQVPLDPLDPLYVADRWKLVINWPSSLSVGKDVTFKFTPVALGSTAVFLDSGMVDVTAVASVLPGHKELFAGYVERTTTSATPLVSRWRYRTDNLYTASATPAELIRTVDVPANTGVMAALQLLADDIFKAQNELKVISAIRSPVLYSPEGMEAATPSMQIVPFQLDDVDSKIVFDMLEVPAGITFAAKPLDQVIRDVFDSQPKSLVLDPVVIRRAKPLGASSDTGVALPMAQSHYGAPMQTELGRKMDQFNRRRSGWYGVL